MVVEDLTERCAALSFAPLPTFAAREPGGPGWTSVVDVVTPGHPLLDRLLEAAAQQPPGPRAVHTLRTLIRELIFCTAASVYLLDAAPGLAPERYRFRARGTEVTDRLLVLTAEARIGAAEGPTVGVHSGRELDAWLAPGFVETVRPLVEIVAARTRVGGRTLWSYVIDMVHFGMLNLARQLGRDRTAAWRRAGELAEELFAAGVPRRSEPSLVRFGEGDGQVWGVRGACCLDFTDGSHGLCLTCPLLDHDARAREFASSSFSGPR